VPIADGWLLEAGTHCSHSELSVLAEEREWSRGRLLLL